MADVKQTLGEYRVGITFNPSNNEDVNAIKQYAAEFIDFCEHARNSTKNNPEAQRLLSLAQTHIEDAAMWAVKAVTKQRREG